LNSACSSSSGAPAPHDDGESTAGLLARCARPWRLFLLLLGAQAQGCTELWTPFHYDDTQNCVQTPGACSQDQLCNPVREVCESALRSLTISTTGIGRGIVTSNVGGLQCGSACSAQLRLGTAVTLTVAADETSLFTGWAGACSGTAPTCTVDIDGDKSVSATFGRPFSCEQLKAASPQATDGPFTLFVESDPSKGWGAFCVMSAVPATYLTLVNTGSANFSQYTAGGARPGTNVVTRYQRVRIDPVSLQVDPNDTTFARSTGMISDGRGGAIGTEVGYGAACDCIAGSSQTGIANVDLGGTPFAVAPAAFQLTGFVPGGTTVYSADSKVVNLTGGGFCGCNNPKVNANSVARLQLLFVGP